MCVYESKILVLNFVQTNHEIQTQKATNLHFKGCCHVPINSTKSRFDKYNKSLCVVTYINIYRFTLEISSLTAEAASGGVLLKSCSQKFRKISPQACSFIKKETLAREFSCEFSEISRNTFFYRTPLVAASVTDVTLT